MVVGGGVGGGAVGEVDWVCGGEGEGGGVAGDGFGVVFARHGGVAAGFEEFGFGGCGGYCCGVCVGGGFGCGCAGACSGAGYSSSSCGRRSGGVFSFELFVNAVDAQEGLRADGVGHVGFVGGVDVVGVGDAGGGYFYAFAVFGG